MERLRENSSTYKMPDFQNIGTLLRDLNPQTEYNLLINTFCLSAPIDAFQSIKPIPFSENGKPIEKQVTGGTATFTSCTVPVSYKGHRVFCPGTAHVRQNLPAETLPAIPVTKEQTDNFNISDRAIQTAIRNAAATQDSAEQLKEMSRLLGEPKGQPAITPTITSVYENPIIVDGQAFYASVHHKKLSLEFKQREPNVSDVQTVYDKKSRLLTITTLSHPFDQDTQTYDDVKTIYKVTKNPDGSISYTCLENKVVYPPGEKIRRSSLLTRLAALLPNVTQAEIINKAKEYELAYKRWELVRLQRAPVLLKGATLDGELVRTGWEGYLDFTKTNNPDELVMDLANIGVVLNNKIAVACLNDSEALSAVNKILTGEEITIKGFLTLNKVFLEQRLECLSQITNRPVYDKFRDETVALAEVWDPKSYREQPDGTIVEEKKIGSPPVALRPVDNLLNDQQKTGLRIAMEIGIVGNENVRAILDIHSQRENPITLPTKKKRTF